MKLSLKSCLLRVVVTGFILFILAFAFGILEALLINADSFNASGHGNPLPYIFVGSVFVSTVFSLLNLFWLLPLSNLMIRFHVPGLISIIVAALLLTSDDIATTIFMIGTGVINLLIGFYHYGRVAKVFS